MGDTTYTCSLDNSGSGNTFAPAPAYQPIQPLPLDFAPFQALLDFASSSCDFWWTGDVDLAGESAVWQSGDASGGVLKPGIYCAVGGKLQLSGSDVSGNVTFVATESVLISGSNFDLSAFHEGVLAYSAWSGDPGINVSGSGGGWQGCLFSPFSITKFAGSGNFSLEGCIIADQISISGSNINLSSSGAGGSGDKIIELYE